MQLIILISSWDIFKEECFIENFLEVFVACVLKFKWEHSSVLTQLIIVLAASNLGPSLSLTLS